MFSLGMTEFYHIIAYVMLAICGVSRLGYFNIKADLDKAVKTYSGLPVTSTAITYPLLGLTHTLVGFKVFSLFYLLLTLLTAILFVVNIKIPKLKGKAYVVIPILAAILVLLLLFI